MNIIRKGVRETLLAPVRVLQGAVDALAEAVNGSSKRESN